MHAEHAHPLRIGRRVGAETHQGGREREARELDQLAQQMARLRPRVDHAAAGVEQRTLGGAHHLDRRLDLVEVALELRLIALVGEILRLEVVALGELDVLRDVDHDRAGPSALRHVERLVQHARQVGDVFDEIVVLGARPGDADGVAFLERVVADQMGRHLAGDADDGNRVHQRVGEPRDRVGGARPRGDQHAADLAGGARIALGRVHGALLVPHQDVADLLLVKQRVVDRQHGAARVAEDMLDPLVGERLDHHFGAGHLGHCWLHSSELVGFVPGIKKGPEGPCSRIATLRGRP